MKAVKVLNVRRYKKAGYEVRDEIWEHNGISIPIKSAYNPKGEWIGSPKEANFLCKKLGIAPEKAQPDHCVCSIGFCRNDWKWYGWSHRAICGFGIGDRIFDEKYGNDKTPFTKHGRRKIETIEQAREAAIKFAESVS